MFNNRIYLYINKINFFSNNIYRHNNNKFILIIIIIRQNIIEKKNHIILNFPVYYTGYRLVLCINGDSNPCPILTYL